MTTQTASRPHLAVAAAGREGDKGRQVKPPRIYREDREASITPSLMRNLIIVAAQQGFHDAQVNLRKEARGEIVRRMVTIPPGESMAIDATRTVMNSTNAPVRIDLRENADGRPK